MPDLCIRSSKCKGTASDIFSPFVFLERNLRASHNVGYAARGVPTSKLPVWFALVLILDARHVWLMLVRREMLITTFKTLISILICDRPPPNFAAISVNDDVANVPQSLF